MARERGLMRLRRLWVTQFGQGDFSVAGPSMMLNVNVSELWSITPEMMRMEAGKRFSDFLDPLFLQGMQRLKGLTTEEVAGLMGIELDPEIQPLALGNSSPLSDRVYSINWHDIPIPRRVSQVAASSSQTSDGGLLVARAKKALSVAMAGITIPRDKASLVAQILHDLQMTAILSVFVKILSITFVHGVFEVDVLTRLLCYTLGTDTQVISEAVATKALSKFGQGEADKGLEYFVRLMVIKALEEWRDVGIRVIFNDDGPLLVLHEDSAAGISVRRSAALNKFSGLRRLKLDKHPQIREPEKYYQMTAAMVLISADTKLLFTPLIMRVVGGNVTTHHMVTRGDETLGFSKLSEVIKYDNRRKFTIKHLNHHLVVKFMNSSPFREYRGAKEAESNKAQIHRAFQSSLRTQPADRANLVSNSVPISCINQVKYYFRGKYNTESKLLARAHTFLKGQAVPSWVLSTLETEALMMVYRSRILGSMIVGTDITGSDGPTGIDPMAAGTVDIDEDAEHDPHSNPSWVGTRDQILGYVGTMNTVQDHEVDFDFMYNKTTGRLKKRYKEQVGQDEDEERRQDVVVRVSNFNDQDIYISLDKAFLESNLISFLVKREGRTVYPKGKTRGRLWDILENETDESPADLRRRMLEVIQEINKASLALEGGRRPLRASFSKTPAERGRASVAGSIKKIVMNHRSNLASELDTDYNQGSAWLGDAQVAGMGAPPAGSAARVVETRAGAAWVDESGISKFLKISRQTVEDEDDLFLLQELPRVPPGWKTTPFGKWKVLGGRVDSQWRGTGLLYHCDAWTVMRKLQADKGTWYRLRQVHTGSEVWVGSIYLKPELSQDEHAVGLQDFLNSLPPTSLPVVLSGDSNSEISWGEDEGGLAVPVGRNGKTLNLLHGLRSRALQVAAPEPGQRRTPTTCPRQVDRRGKQIDFLATARGSTSNMSILVDSHKVLGTDHEVLSVQISLAKRRVFRKTDTRPRRLVSEVPPVASLDQLELERLARVHTAPKKGKGYHGPEDVKALFRIARHGRSREDWKQAFQARRKARALWQRQQLEEACKGNWGAFRRYRKKSNSDWELSFADSHPDPHNAIHTHLQSIYEAAETVPEVTPMLPFVPFSMDELKHAVHLGKNGVCVSHDGVSQELLHGIMRAEGGADALLAWFNRLLWNKTVLCANTPLHARLNLLEKVVAGAGLWCISAFFPETSALHLVNTFHMQLVITMMGLKRGPLDDWLSFRKKAFRAARGALWRGSHQRWSTIWVQRFWLYMGHCARSLLHSPTPAAAVLCAYRTREWWLAEQKKKNGITHPGRLYPRLMNSEMSLDLVAGGPWRVRAQDRAIWSGLLGDWVKHADCPWSSGRQLSLRQGE
eukprot:s4246_g5.t1